MKLGYRIYTQMKELGLNQSELAKKSGLSQQIISNYINNKFKPGYDAILALSRALEVQPAWFFDRNPPTGNVIAFGKVQRGGALKIGQLLPMDSIPSPVLHDKETGIVMNLYWFMFDKLVRSNTLSGSKGGIAYNWKSGGSYCIFDLFSGITFHNGQVCTAEDVEYSYRKWMSQNKEDNPITRTQVIDAHTFLLELNRECKTSELPMPFIVPKGTYDRDYKLVGTGPFKAVDIQPGIWKLRKHKGYHRGEPFLDEVIVRRYQNKKELEKALKKGQINLALGIDIEDERFKVQTESIVQRYELVFRLSSPLCRDIRFRKAIYWGLDRAAIAKAAGIRKPLFAKGAFDYLLDERSFSPIVPNRKKAKQLLNEIPNINDTCLTIELSSVDPKREKIVNEIINQLLALGIQADTVESGGQAEVVLLNTRTPCLERQIWKKDGIANVSGYYNPLVENLLDNLTPTCTDTTLMKKVQSVVLEDYPSVPLFYNQEPITYVKNLRALENRMILMTMLDDIHTWYFEAETELVQFPERVKQERGVRTSLSSVS